MDLKEVLGKKKAISPDVKDAKLKALKEMRGVASSMMGDGLKGHLSKATVVSDSEEGLKSGLEKAKAALAEKQPMMEAAEEKMGMDLDGDDEEGESVDHMAKLMASEAGVPELSSGGIEDDDTEELISMIESPEQADEMIKRLLAKKAELTPKY